MTLYERFDIQKPALRIASTFFLFGMVWISITDRALALLSGELNSTEPAQSYLFFMSLQTYKGWLFVVFTTVLIYWLSWRQIKQHLQIERELRESRRRYSALFQAAPVSIWEEDFSAYHSALESLRQAGVTDIRRYMKEHPAFVKEAARLVRILDVNHATLQLFGARDRTQLLGGLDRILNPEAMEVLREELVSLGEGKTFFQSEVKCSTLQGTPLDVILSVRLSPEVAESHYAVVSMVNITYRKRAEEALRASEGRWRAVFETAAEAIIVTDETGKVASFNGAAERVFGYTAAEMLGENAHRLTLAPTERCDNTLANCLCYPQTAVHGEVREGIGRRKDGTTVPVAVAASQFVIGERRFFASILSDITDRKRAEQALRESERRLATLLSNLPGMAYRRLPDEQWTTLFVSRGARLLTGYKADELMSHHVQYMDLIEPDDRARVRRAVRDAVARRQCYQLEYRIRCRDGHERWVWEQGEGVFDFNGAPLAVEGFITDITDRKQAEEQARQHRAQLAHLDRVNTMGTMAAGIAHEISQPLTAINAYAQAVKRRITSGTADTAKLLDLIGKISAAAERAGAVMTKLRSLLKRGNTHHEWLDINELVRGVIDLVTVDSRFLHFRIDLRLTPAAPKAMGDAVQIQQVVLNLIRNAMDAMEGVPAEDKVITVSTFQEGGSEVGIAIGDRGLGMPDEVAARLFTPFFTTKESGLGMGLAISQSIIESHGGKLWYTHNENRGMTFHFSLPVASVDQRNVSADTA